MIPFVSLTRVLPNVKEVTETSSGNSTTEKHNKSISISSSESSCKEGTEADKNTKQEHTTIAENPSAKTLQENETDMSERTLSEISENSRSDSTDTITRMKTAAVLWKLQQKNESSTNNPIKEDDEHLSNKENRASNIEDLQNEDVTVSNILSQSPQPLIVSDICTEKSVKENDEDAGSSDNTQNLIVTDTESLSETPLNDSICRSTLCIEISNENIQILKCPENENNINSVSLLNDTEDQNALSVKIQDDSNQGGGIQIQKCEENINFTHTDKHFGFDNNKKEQIQPITSEDETITKDNNDEMPDDIEMNEIPKTVQKQEEKMQVDDNLSDAHIGTDLFQDIPAGEWKERNSEKNSVHSMSTERLENEDVSNERKSLYKSIEKSDSEVEEPREADNDSLNKSPIGSPSNVSDSSKTDESMDSDIEREYNLQGVEVCKFSDDDVPGDECRASETESSDPDDNGSDLADFVVNDDDEISEEGIDSSEIEVESYNADDDKHRESDKDAVDEERGRMQMKHESNEKTMKNGKEKKIDKGTFKKEKSKSKKSAKLGLDKITESNKKIAKSEIGTIDKKRKRNKIKRCIEEQEIDEKELDKESVKVQIHEEIMGKISKKGQHKRGMEENVQGIQNKCTDTREKEKSKLKKTTKLDLSEMSESGKNFKRKFKIETGNKIKKIKAGDNDNTMQKENAIPTLKKYENPMVKSNKMEMSRKRGRNLLEEVRSSPSNITMNKLKKRKLLSFEDLPSCSILDSLNEKSDTNVEQNFTLLSAYGSTTNFYITNIQKFKKRKNNLEVNLFRQRMLLKKRRLANYTMFLEKQKALCTHKL